MKESKVFFEFIYSETVNSVFFFFSLSNVTFRWQSSHVGLKMRVIYEWRSAQHSTLN